MTVILSRPRNGLHSCVAKISNLLYRRFPTCTARAVLQGHRCAFTLLETMIVLAIIAMIMAMGVPSLVYSMRKDALRQGISDVIEACSNARAQAIINGLPAEVRFAPHSHSMSVAMAAVPSDPDKPSEDAEPSSAPAPAAAGPLFSAHLSDQLVIEMLDVNFQEKKDEPEARVRFYPNGTSDEFTIVLRAPDRNQYRKISLDIITGLADVEVIR